MSESILIYQEPGIDKMEVLFKRAAEHMGDMRFFLGPRSWDERTLDIPLLTMIPGGPSVIAGDIGYLKLKPFGPRREDGMTVPVRDLVYKMHGLACRDVPDMEWEYLSADLYLGYSGGYISYKETGRMFTFDISVPPREIAKQQCDIDADFYDVLRMRLLRAYGDIYERLERESMGPLFYYGLLQGLRHTGRISPLGLHAVREERSTYKDRLLSLIKRDIPHRTSGLRDYAGWRFLNERDAE